MLGVFGQMQQAFHAVWVANTGTVARGLEKSKLAAEQIAVFAADDYSKEGTISLVKPTFGKHKRLVIKMGLKPFKGQLAPALSRQDKKARSTIEFTKDQVVGWKGFKSKLKNSTDVVAIGYDGLDASKTLTGVLDAKPLHVNLILSGEPIQRTFHTNRIAHRLVIDKGLCTSDCECYDSCGKVKCDVVADQIVKLVNREKVLHTIGGKIVQVPLNNFIKANKIVKCTTPETPPTLIEYQKYTLQVVGDNATSIAELQSAYTTSKIELESVVAGVSTYTTWVKVGDTPPSDFTLTDYVVPYCNECPDCPVDSTVVEGLKVVQVTVACGSTAPTITGQISSTLMNSSLTGGDVYLIKVPLITTDAAIETELDAVGCLDYSIIGSEGKSCVLASKTFSWVQCESCFKTEQDFQIILPDKNCEAGISRLTELQEAYSTTITQVAVGNCSRAYTMTVESECVAQEDCGRLVNYHFTTPASYEGFQWSEVKPILAEPDCTAPGASTEPCCVCGVIFETAVWNEHIPSECEFGWFTYHPNDKKPVRLQVNIESLDYSDNPCDVTSSYSTVLRKLELDVSAPGTYVEEVERNFLTYENKHWQSSPYYNDLVGFKKHALSHKIYDQYVLSLKLPQVGHELVYNQATIDYVFYVESGKGKQFETFMNELVLSAGNPDLKAVVL